MIVRSFARCPRLVRQVLPRSRAPVRSSTRTYSTSSASPIPPSPPQSSAALLGTITTELDKISPRFEIHAGQIQIIQTPSEFYETLKAKILRAQRRIYLSTLYIGKTEHELISTIREALQRNPDLKVSFLTDALRGTRETPKASCASLLAPLVADFGPERVEVRMFHTPNLTGLRKRLVPQRINEGWGLQHMKLYGVDDELIMSGANLSTDYFTNRQDRYHIFKSKEITDYFHRIHDAVCSLSYSILPNPNDPMGYLMDWPSANRSPSPLSSPSAFKEHASSLLTPLMASPPVPPSHHAPSNGSALVYPLLQFTPLMNPDFSTELPALTAILRLLATPAFAGSSWTFTAGYFNMTPQVRRLLLATRPSQATVIAASPWANGFYGSAGVSGMLPDAYTLLSRRFLDSVRRAGLSSHITLKEWRRGTVTDGGWTYHAKGLWIALPGEELPSIALVGSSNYTKRSYRLDLEANALIITRDEGLRKRLNEEVRWLGEYATAVGSEEYEKPERKVRWTVRVAMWIVTVLGGAL